MQWRKEDRLRADQTGHPILWHGTLGKLGYLNARMPVLSAKWFHDFWGDDGTSGRLRTFGHEDPSDRLSPHFLCTRGGTGMHVDPGYTRYALQIQIHNSGGFLVHGLEDDIDKMPLFKPGLVILLDTHSPHRVRRDPRLPRTGNNKVLCGGDYVELPDIAAEVKKLVAYIPKLAQVPTGGLRAAEKVDA